MTDSPIGPQPMTIATLRLRTSPRRTACQATAIGSVSAATSEPRPLGTGIISDSSTSSCSAKAPGACTDRPTVSTPRLPRKSGRATTGVPVGELFRHWGPCSTTSPQNSWPKTIGSSERANRS